MWIFGYGSLIWRPDVEYSKKRVGYIRGWARRFYQKSVTHRGTPDDPGRVATLVSVSNMNHVFGVAYRIPSDIKDSVLSKLDIREKDGYLKREVSVQLQDDVERSSIDSALIYIATKQNPNWSGGESPETIAKNIVGSSGQSGDNADYLFRLASSLREMNAEAAHVFELEKKVRRLLDHST